MPKKSSERFRKIRKQTTPASEPFRNPDTLSEKTADHTLTVREAAKTFENKGVLRTERSIINWCNPNRQGMTRLDCYYEENEGKYYITPISVERVIAEEQNKLKIKAKVDSAEAGTIFSEDPNNGSERFGNQADNFGSVPNSSEANMPEVTEQLVKELERENRDLEISNRVKDIYIERLEGNQQDLIKQLTDKSHRIGELETEMRLLQPPARNRNQGVFNDEPEAAVEAEGETQDSVGESETNETGAQETGEALMPRTTGEVDDHDKTSE